MSELLAAAGARDDAWIVVETGMKLPLSADLEDDDGLPDTTDNNGDGRVDKDDGVGSFTYKVTRVHVVAIGHFFGGRLNALDL